MKGSLQRFSVVFVCLVVLFTTSCRAAGNNAQEVLALKKENAQLQERIKLLETQLNAKEQDSHEADVSGSVGMLFSEDTWDPFAEIDAVQRRMNALMQLRAHPSGVMGVQQAMFVPDYDIRENDKSYLVSFDMPGMDKSKIDVQIKEGALIVGGERTTEKTEENKKDRYYRQERSFGAFSKMIPLPKNANPDTIDAKYDNGVLTVTVDKKEVSPVTTKKIEIK